DSAQIRRFYRRQGGNLALFYALSATDMHAENVIAHGEHPVVVDVEALLHANLDCGMAAHAAARLARHAMTNSVLRPGLLPQRIFAGDAWGGGALSARGAGDEHFTPQPAPQWLDAGTDEFRMVRERVPMAIKGNRPTVNGMEFSFLDYAQELEAGF